MNSGLKNSSALIFLAQSAEKRQKFAVTASRGWANWAKLISEPTFKTNERAGVVLSCFFLKMETLLKCRIIFILNKSSINVYATKQLVTEIRPHIKKSNMMSLQYKLYWKNATCHCTTLTWVLWMDEFPWLKLMVVFLISCQNSRPRFFSSK